MDLAIEVFYVLVDMIFAGLVMCLYGLVPFVAIFYMISKYREWRNKLTEIKSRRKNANNIRQAAYWLDQPLQFMLLYISDVLLSECDIQISGEHLRHLNDAHKPKRFEEKEDWALLLEAFGVDKFCISCVDKGDICFHCDKNPKNDNYYKNRSGSAEDALDAVIDDEIKKHYQEVPDDSETSIDYSKGYTEVIYPDGTKKEIQDRMLLKKDDIFRGHDAAGGEGIGPWMEALDDPYRDETGVCIKARPARKQDF